VGWLTSRTKEKRQSAGAPPAKPAATVNRPFVLNNKCLIRAVLQKKDKIKKEREIAEKARSRAISRSGSSLGKVD
jgi:hypothetical protein